MNREKWCLGKIVSLEEILNDKEERFQNQKRLISNSQRTLICFTLNIVGPVKRFLLGDKAFEEGLYLIEKKLEIFQCEVVQLEKNISDCGYEAYFVLEESPLELKRMMTEIEEAHPLGRLFDIDVLDGNLSKISRKKVGFKERRCLLCNEPVLHCGPRRKHSAEELFNKECEIIWGYLKNKQSDAIAGLFSKGLIYEVTTTPKPGLVDRHHNGTHKDMDIGLFMTSIDALIPYFKESVAIGFETEVLSELFLSLRTAGIKAEEQMYQATNEVNTHKGLIFSGGILCGIIGYLYAQNDEISNEILEETSRKALKSLEDDFENIRQDQGKSHGEILYLKYGLKGIRGEALNGFPSVFKMGTKVFNDCVKANFSWYTSGRITLLYLMAYSEDTNIITRSDYETFQKIQKFLRRFLERNPIGTYDEKTLIKLLDTYFEFKNISPGGSADLLALVYFIFFLENYLKK